jgi:predicted alpha/beta superfamily hydrolase
MQEHFPIAAAIPSGNGLGFMQFLRRELIPFIETDYRADPSARTLLGHSMGANFALYTLFHPPDLSTGV